MADPVEVRIARRLLALRTERGWPLEQASQRSGIARATLSRIERAEVSPTAAILNKLCAAYGWTLSQLMSDAESGTPSLIKAATQETWRDPQSGYTRRLISPPARGLIGEMVAVEVPPRSTVAFDEPAVYGLEHHIWMVAGALKLTLGDSEFRLERGDCLRYLLTGASRFEAGPKGAHYLLAIFRKGEPSA